MLKWPQMHQFTSKFLKSFQEKRLYTVYI